MNDKFKMFILDIYNKYDLCHITLQEEEDHKQEKKQINKKNEE